MIVLAIIVAAALLLVLLLMLSEYRYRSRVRAIMEKNLALSRQRIVITDKATNQVMVDVTVEQARALANGCLICCKLLQDYAPVLIITPGVLVHLKCSLPFRIERLEVKS